MTNAALGAQLAEFSGNPSTGLVDQTGSATGTTSPLVATAAGVDGASGELIVYGSAMRYSAGAAKTISTALNNATAADTTDNTLASANHYDFGYGVATGNSAADQATLSFTTTSILGTALAVVSFAVAATATPVALAGDGQTSSCGQGPRSVAVTLAAAGASAVTATAALSVAVPLAAGGQATSAAPGSLTAGVPLTATGAGRSVAQAAFTVATSAYRTAILADSPASYYRLDDTAATAVDQQAVDTGAYSGTYTPAIAGALTGDPDTATRFTAGQIALTSNPLNVGAVTIEMWLQTTSTATSSPVDIRGVAPTGTNGVARIGAAAGTLSFVDGRVLARSRPDHRPTRPRADGRHNRDHAE